MSKTPQEINEQIAKVIAGHPGLPVKVLAPSTPSDFSTYWHDAYGASIEWLLYPTEVQGDYWKDRSHWERHYVGLNDEKIYSDEDDAVDDVSEWLFGVWYDEAHKHGMGQLESATTIPDDLLTTFCGFNYGYSPFSMADMCDEVARAMVRDMPWHETIVIDCY